MGGALHEVPVAAEGVRAVADANETAEAWRMALERTAGPTLLALTRQKVSVLDRDEPAGAEEARRGTYVLAPERSPGAPDAVLLATGSEVHVAPEARERLRDDDVDARVVSMPCWQLFRAQDREYRDSVLAPDAPCHVAVEAASPTHFKPTRCISWIDRNHRSTISSTSASRTGWTTSPGTS